MSRFWPTALCGAVALLAVLRWGLAVRGDPAPAAPVIVNDVIIQGNRLIANDQIKVQMKTRVGSEYKADVLQEDIRTLYNTRQFTDIKASTEAAGPGRVNVLLYVQDYAQAVEKVTYQGAKHLKDDELNELTQVRVGAPLNPLANKTACQRIVARYNELGRPFASCVLLKGGQPGDKEVVFQITEGREVVVRAIRFEGNTFVSGGVLATHIHSSHQILWLFSGKYQPPMVEADVNELEKYYRSFGFHDVKVSREVQWDSSGESIVLVFHIHEGLRYKVLDVPQVVGAKSVPHEQLEAMSKVSANSYYNETTVQKDVLTLKDYYGFMGQPAKVEAIPVWSLDTPGVCRVQYQVEERPPDKVGQIFIVGNERTRDNVILRQLPLYPGQLLTYPDLRVAERNLARLNIFATTPDGSVHPTVEVMPSDTEYKDVLVTVQEDNTGSLMFGVGVNSDAGLTGSIVLNERNFDLFRVPTSIDDLLSGNAFRGAGQELRIEAMPGTQVQRYTVTFREPFLFDSPYTLMVSGYYFERVFNEDTESRLGGRFQVGRRLDQHWQVYVGGRIEDVGIHNVSIFAPIDYQEVVGNNFVLGGYAGITYDSRDSFLRPTSGSNVDFRVEEVTGDKTFTLATIDANKYFTTWQRDDGSGKQVLVAHSQFGWASDNTPVFERYFAGGFRSLRGFAFRGVGPDIDGFKIGGDFMWLNSLEYQVPVKADDTIYLVGFVDSGTVSPKIDQWDSYRVSAGFGIRFVVPMLGPVPIALDFGFPIVKGSADNTQVFSFFMGFSR
jgi:outer membrane protein assembly complex protein YaeT